MAGKGKGNELPIITFSTDKYMDRQTLGRIRSHAQQRVQDRKKPQRRLKKDKQASNPETGEASSSSTPDILEEDGTVHEFAPPTSIATVNGREDPFDAFPVPINAEFMDIFDRFYTHWNWQRPKDFLFRETMSHATLAHSFLAVSYRLWRNDSFRSISFANKTIQGIMELMSKSRESAPTRRPQLLYVVTCSIVRLAILDIEEGHFERAAHHLGGLNSVRPELNGYTEGFFMSQLQSAVVSLLLLADSTGASKIVRNCLAYPLDLNAPALDGVLAQGFVVPPTSLFLEPEIQGLVDSPSMTDLYLALTAIFNTNAQHPPASSRQAISSSQIALRLINLTQTQSSAPETALQACLRRTALIFTWSFGRHVVASTDFVVKAREENVQALSKTEFTSSLPFDLPLWLFVINGSTADRSGAHRYVELIKASFPHISDWSSDMLRNHLGARLPWVEDSERPAMCEFWEW